MPLILLDQDGPLADFDTAIHDVLDEAGYDSSLLRRTRWETTADVRRCFGSHAARIVETARHAPGFYRDLRVVSGAREAVAHLLEAGCHVVVCTAPSLQNETCASEKIAWLAEHFPELRKSFAVVKDKTLVRGDVLVDDKPVVSGALTPTWEHLRFATPGNAHISDGHVLQSWAEWPDVLKLAQC